jgi:TonB family protein
MKQPDKANEIEARTIIGKILNVDAAGNVTDMAEAKNAGGGVLNGRAIKRYAPPYPPEAKANRVTGKVTVRVLVDEKGKVIDACAIDGPTLLLQSAENAAYLTAFSPTLVSGQPVKVAGTITFNYSLY